MLQLRPEEKIIIAVHRHWFAVARQLTAVILLLIVPVAVLFFLNFLPRDFSGFILYFLILYLLIILFFAFRIWIDYYLDMWIVTNERIIDIEQTGLFRREISEIPFSRVQDATIKIPGFLATILKYGTIIVQTAGEQSFFIHEIPKVYEVKDAILENIKKLPHP
jgi:membrane protein YdbS with pleckstrin-like domain